MSKKINYSRLLKEKIAPFFLSIFVIIFWYISYNIESEANFIKAVGSYIDDTLLYKRIYTDNNHENEVVIVKIDEKTLNNLQKSDIKVLSFSKELYAQTIETLIEHYEVANIGVDIIFANTSHYWEEDEIKLQKTLDTYKDKVVIASRWDMKDIPLCTYASAPHGAIEIISENRVRKVQINYDDYDLWETCWENTENNGIQAFAIEVYKSHLSGITNKLKAKKKFKELEKKLHEQQEKNNGQFYFNYSTNLEKNSGSFGFRSYSLIDILEKKDIDLSGKIILIGEVWTVLHDKQFTPINFTYQMPGVEIHANVLTSLLYNSYLEKIHTYILLCITIFSVFVCFAIILYTRTIVNSLITIFIILVHLVIWLQLFVLWYIYPVFFMIYILLLTFISAYIYKFSITDKNRRFLKKAFSMYVSSDMVDMIYKDPTKLNLKGEESEITVFFSDIAGFTNLWEKFNTEKLFYFLNDYFSEMTKILLINQWTLDKYIGDAVMAFFNAPLEVDNHEFLACKTALMQQKKLKSINQRNKEKGLPEIQIRIGINTWNVMHGNLGTSGKKINYTVIGDNVNIASRLEWINKMYGTNIIISENTYKKVQEDFTFREIDTITVKGKSKALKIYELLGYKKDAGNFSNILKNYESGLQAYYATDYKTAIMYFEKIPNDPVSQVMKIRSQDILEGKIEVENGIYKFTSK